MLPYNYKLKKLKGDASFRTFYRQIKETKKSVIVHASKEKEKNLLIYETLTGDEIRDLILKDIKPTRSFKDEKEIDGKASSALGSLGVKPKPAV